MAARHWIQSLLVFAAATVSGEPVEAGAERCITREQVATSYAARDHMHSWVIKGDQLRLLLSAARVDAEGSEALLMERAEFPIAYVVTFIDGCGKDTFAIDRSVARAVLEASYL